MASPATVAPPAAPLTTPSPVVPPPVALLTAAPPLLPYAVLTAAPLTAAPVPITTPAPVAPGTAPPVWGPASPTKRPAKTLRASSEASLPHFPEEFNPFEQQELRYLAPASASVKRLQAPVPPTMRKITSPAPLRGMQSPPFAERPPSGVPDDDGLGSTLAPLRFASHQEDAALPPASPNGAPVEENRSGESAAQKMLRFLQENRSGESAAQKMLRVQGLLACMLVGIVVMGMALLCQRGRPGRETASRGDKVRVTSGFLGTGRRVGYTRLNEGTEGIVTKREPDGALMVRFDGHLGQFKVGQAEASHLQW